MTIVVYKDGVLAADRVCSAGAFTHAFRKVYSIYSPRDRFTYLVGVAGSLPEVGNFLNQITKCVENLTPSDCWEFPTFEDMRALVVEVDRVEQACSVLQVDHGVVVHLPADGFYAIGNEPYCFAAQVLHRTINDPSAITIVCSVEKGACVTGFGIDDLKVSDFL
jgi:hypothetical protein